MPLLTRTPRSHQFTACALTLAGIATLVALGGCSKGSAAAAPTSGSAPVTVTLEPAVEKTDFQRYVRIVGSLAAYEKATLSNRVTGTVQKIYVDMGVVVKPSQKLAEIESQRFRMAVEQARQVQQETLARLVLKEIPTDETFNVDNTSPVQKALADQSAAKNKYDRAETLYKQQLIKDFEWLDTQAVYRIAQTQVQATRDEARALLSTAREANAVMAMRQKDLDDSIIYAPDGQVPHGDSVSNYRVAERRVSVGEYLREGTTLFVLVADDKLKLQARVPEGELSRVRLGQTIAFNVEAYGTRAFSGKITALDPTVEPASRIFMVEATVDNPEHLLRAGSFVQGRILTELQTVVMVPVDSLTSFAGVTKLFVTADDHGTLKAHQVEVMPGQQEGNLVEIPSGVKPGDRIVTSGQTKLFDGSPVQLRTAATTGPATSSTQAERR